jgi:hypothetical protein
VGKAVASAGTFAEVTVAAELLVGFKVAHSSALRTFSEVQRRKATALGMPAISRGARNPKSSLLSSDTGNVSDSIMSIARGLNSPAHDFFLQGSIIESNKSYNKIFAVCGEFKAVGAKWIKNINAEKVQRTRSRLINLSKEIDAARQSYMDSALVYLATRAFVRSLKSGVSPTKSLVNQRITYV